MRRIALPLASKPRSASTARYSLRGINDPLKRDIRKYRREKQAVVTLREAAAKSEQPAKPSAQARHFIEITKWGSAAIPRHEPNRLVR